MNIQNPNSKGRGKKEVVIVHEERSGERSQPGKKMKGSSDKTDSRILKRRNAKLREKTRELLALVDELTHNCEFYKDALKHKDDREEKETYRLLKENESLNLEIFKLGQVIDEWQEKCLKMENKNAALTKAKILTKENKNLLEDLEVLKSVICRLNRELAYYQDKLRSKHKDAPENIPLYSTSSTEDFEDRSKSSARMSQSCEAKDWLYNPKGSLLPLLVAYDEVIAEKEEIIRDHEMTLERFKAKCLTIVKENSDLQKLISENKEKGSISINDWETLRTNAVLVLEENDILHDQVDNLKRKEEKIFSTYQEKIAAFQTTISLLESEVGKQKRIIGELEGKCNKLSEDNMNLTVNNETRIPREKHESMVHEFKQAFDELKITYDTDKKNLSDKVTSIEKERERLIQEVSNLETENSRLRADIRDCENSLTANIQAMQQMKASMQEATSARDAANKVTEDLMKQIQQMVADKNALIEEFNEQRAVQEKMMSLRTEEKQLVAKLQEKNEAIRRLHKEEMRDVLIRVKELEEGIQDQTERHRRETQRFNEMLNEKDKRIQSVETEKKQLQLDLETVWRTTTATLQTTLKNRQN